MISPTIKNETKKAINMIRDLVEKVENVKKRYIIYTKRWKS